MACYKVTGLRNGNEHTSKVIQHPQIKKPLHYNGPVAGKYDQNNMDKYDSSSMEDMQR
jgi:hypothetical protein